MQNRGQEDMHGPSERKRRYFRLVCVFILLTAALLLYRYKDHDFLNMILRKHTVASVLSEIGEAEDARWAPRFSAHDLPYPPPALTLLALKEERRLEVWAPAPGGFRQIHTYPILAASGALGPKLQEGDRQVPEGIYRLTSLNPNSAFHLSIRVDYPNAFDLARAGEEGRTNPGSDIFIHGREASIGCIALGDPAIEELFTLLARTGLENTRLLIAPRDLRVHASPASPVPWMPGLYQQLKAEMAPLDSSFEH